MKSAISILLVLFSVHAQASKSEWVLEKKNSGPESFTCPQEATLEVTESFVEMNGKNFYFRAENINGERSCIRNQNGSFFGTLRCDLNILKKSSSKIIFTQQSCGTDMPLISSCDPRKEYPNKKIQVTAAGTMIVSSLTGWQDAPVYECAFKLK